MSAAARLFVKEAVEKIYTNGLRICMGCETELDELAGKTEQLESRQPHEKQPEGYGSRIC